MNGWVIFAAILLSLAGLVYLAVTDPKRRRIHNQPKIERRPFLWPARLAVFGPGIYLIFIGHWSGLTIWAGAITTLGWAIAAITPQTYKALLNDFQSKLRIGIAKTKELSGYIPRLPIQYVPARFRGRRLNLPHLTKAATKTSYLREIEALKARVADLEMRLSLLEEQDVPIVFSKAEESHKARLKRPNYSTE